MYQQVVIIGHVGKEAELRYLPSGTAVCAVSIATNKKIYDKDGNVTETTVWWRVTGYEYNAEKLSRASKGNLILAIGEMTADTGGNPRTWQTADGECRANHEMTAYFIRNLSGKAEDEEGDW